MRSPSEFAATVQEPTLDLCAAAPSEPFIRRIWPTAIIFFGLGLTVAWVGLLIYGLTKLVVLAI